MERMRYSNEDMAFLRRNARLEKDIFPIDHRIQRLRTEIRKRVEHLRRMKEKGYPAYHSRRVLVLMCRTLAADRAYRRAMIKAIVSGAR